MEPSLWKVLSGSFSPAVPCKEGRRQQRQRVPRGRGGRKALRGNMSTFNCLLVIPESLLCTWCWSPPGMPVVAGCVALRWGCAGSAPLPESRLPFLSPLLSGTRRVRAGTALRAACLGLLNDTLQWGYLWPHGPWHSSNLETACRGGSHSAALIQPPLPTSSVGP